ncbi:MAG: hypothetical protein COA96_16730 [SAR86 cluster bacterium]|uniref:Uncharacterized protein n=1 Tax=SAR86 cluster bacterium TaxID=2030880 RepID=A0A2A5AG93_9GAMM|nr:MAG: hypothetical protein COA96_16730 [SAR86 cluster bacterium]
MGIGKDRYQDFWIVGSRAYLMRDDDAAGTLYDLGVISEAVQPTLEVNKTELPDGDGGIQRIVDESVTSIDETWEIEVANHSPSNLAHWYLSSPAEVFDQPTGAALTSVSHTAVIESGGFIKVVDNSGNWLFNIASALIATHAEGVDWKWHDNQGQMRGIIEVIDGGGIAEGDTLLITPVLNTLSGKRLIKPHSAGNSIKGKMMIVYGRGQNAQQTVREAEVSLTPSGATLSPTEYSKLSFTARVLSDITDSAMSGRMLQINGDVPETASGS